MSLDPKDSDGFAKIIDELEEKLDSGSLSKLIDSPSFLGRWGLPLDSDYANLEGRTKAETLIERLSELRILQLQRIRNKADAQFKYDFNLQSLLGNDEFQIMMEELTGMDYGYGEGELNSRSLDQWMKSDPSNKSALLSMLKEESKNFTVEQAARIDELSKFIDSGGKQTIIVYDTKNVNAQQGPRIDRSQTFFIGGPQVQYGPLNERGNF